MKIIFDIARQWSRLRFCSAVICATATLLVLLNLGSEIDAWRMFDAMGYTLGQKILVIAFTWLMSGTFWMWILIAVFCSLAVWRKANETIEANEATSVHDDVEIKKFSLIKIWYGVLGIMPAYGVSSAMNRYATVNGVWQKVDSTFEDYLYGFLSGLMVALLLYGLTKGVQKLISLKANSNHTEI